MCGGGGGGGGVGEEGGGGGVAGGLLPIQKWEVRHATVLIHVYGEAFVHLCQVKSGHTWVGWGVVGY